MRPLPRPTLREVPRITLRNAPLPILCSLALFLTLTMMSFAAIGCGDGGVATSDVTATVSSTETSVNETTSLSVETTSPSATVTSAPASDGTSTSSEEVLPNGNIKACGIIKEVWSDSGTHKIKIDYVDFLTGDAADAAAVAAGEIAAGEHVDNDYYIRNNNPKLRTFTVSGSAVITTDDRSLPPGHLVTHTWSEFAGFWTLSGEEAWLSRMPWWIERDGNTVVRIDQQFLP